MTDYLQSHGRWIRLNAKADPPMDASISGTSRSTRPNAVPARLITIKVNTIAFVMQGT